MIHRPDPRRVGGRCRVDCTCGWQGVPRATFGDSWCSWRDHFDERARVEPAEEVS